MHPAEWVWFEMFYSLECPQLNFAAADNQIMLLRVQVMNLTLTQHPCHQSTMPRHP